MNTASDVKEKPESSVKKTSYDLASDAGVIKMEIERVIIDDPDDAEERLNELFALLENAYEGMEEKIVSMRWVKDKISEQVEASKAVKEYYDEQKKKFYSTEKARGNDLSRLKERVVWILEKLPDGKAKVDGKNISIAEYISGAITDEALAHETLRESGLSWAEYHLDGEKVKNLKAKTFDVLLSMQDESGDLKHVDLVDLQTKIMNMHDEIAQAQPVYQFASGKDINAFVGEQIKRRREVTLKVAAQFGGVDPDDMDADEQARYSELLEAELEAYPLSGIEVHITKSPRGF